MAYGPTLASHAATAADGVSLANWLPVTATLLAALIAATVAVYQVRRNVAAQRELEVERARNAERAAELALERAEHSQARARVSTYHREQVLPFLDALNRTLDASYVAAYLPPHFADLGGYIPQIRAHADKALSEWMTRHREMSQHRMRLLLFLPQGSVQEVVDQLLSLQQRMEELLWARHRVWYGSISISDLWESHRRYMEVGYPLLMHIRALAMSPYPGTSDPVSSPPDDKSMAVAMAKSLEKLSAVVLPYGHPDDFTWIALWDLDVRPEWLSSLESMHQGSHDEFQAALASFAKELHHDPDTIEVQLIRLAGSDSREVSCLAVKLASNGDLDTFVSAGLPRCRKRYPALWASMRLPVEFKLAPTDNDSRSEHEGVSALSPSSSRPSGS